MTLDFQISFSLEQLILGVAVLAILSNVIQYFTGKKIKTIFGKDTRIQHASESQKLLYKADHSSVVLSRKNKTRHSSYPTEHPEGWYVVCRSSEIKKLETKYVEIVGLDLAVFRGEDGKVRSIDAYCPHIGANLAFGSKVIDNCIECPFHLWKFEGDTGKCTHIPYTTTIPNVAKTKYWITKEYNGFVVIFHSLDETRRLNPPYELLVIEPIESGRFKHRGDSEAYIHMHIQEFAENSVDFQHFQPVHGNMVIPFTDIPIPGLKIKHSAKWELDEDNGHICYFHDDAQLSFRGKLIPNTAAKATITFMGCGGVVMFKFSTPAGDIHLFQTHSPLEPLLLKVHFRWYADPKIPRIIVAYVVGNWLSQWRNDIIIWENKKFFTKPLVVKGDGPIMKLRRWYAQFYSKEYAKNSPQSQENSDNDENNDVSTDCKNSGSIDW